MKKLLLFLFLITFLQISAQEDAWVFLKDKPKAATFLENPLTMLSQLSLDRRNRQDIVVDIKDVPVDIDYYNDLKEVPNLTVLAKSKWLNAIHVQGTEEVINELTSTLTFVDYIEFANKSLNKSGKKIGKPIKPNHHNKFSEIKTEFDYGETSNQIKMLNGDFLHKEANLTGQGAIIAVIDAGFPNVNTLEAFKRLRDNNQILGGYDFVERNSNFYSGHNHGTNVLSTIGGFLENTFVGSAPDASFYLFRTEDAANEIPLEESLWVEAAERADSLGVDVITSSLGYTTFDNSNYNYSYEDMDGKTTFISRGAEIGTTRGMLIVVSAGNEGNSSWKYISAPADATSVITVGAVNENEEIASFSSFGPTFDGRIKPEILAKGQGAAVINHTSGTVSTANGTSFSAPIMAGLIACLNKNENFALKSSNKNTAENYIYNLKKALYESADRYENPLDQYGYGIPNFGLAFDLYASSTASVEDSFLSKLNIYPNPAENTFTFANQSIDLKNYSVHIYNLLGKKVFDQKKLTENTLNISLLKSGIYLLKISKGNHSKVIKLIKK